MLIRWQKTIVDRRGNVQPGAVLTIRRMSDQAIVTVYRDGAGLDPYPTGTVTADENGYAYLYAAPGLYRITSTQPAIDWPDVSLSAPVVNVGGQTYESIEDGLGATSDGEFFSVSPSIYPGGLFDVYRNDDGSAELVGTQPSLEAVDEIRATAAQSLLGPYADTTEGMKHAAEDQYFYVETESGDLDLYRNMGGAAQYVNTYPDRDAVILAISAIGLAYSAPYVNRRVPYQFRDDEGGDYETDLNGQIMAGATVVMAIPRLQRVPYQFRDDEGGTFETDLRGVVIGGSVVTEQILATPILRRVPYQNRGDGGGAWVTDMVGVIIGGASIPSGGGSESEPKLRISKSGADFSIFFKGSGNNWIEILLIHQVAPDNPGGNGTGNARSELWRINQGWECDSNRNRLRVIIHTGEWECAVREIDTDDFVGGYHGDEIASTAYVLIDGVYVDPVAWLGDKAVETFDFVQVSDIYRCNVYPGVVIAKHLKHLRFAADGIRINQRLEWLVDTQLVDGYMAMLPIKWQTLDASGGDVITDHARREPDYDILDPASPLAPFQIENVADHSGNLRVYTKDTKAFQIWGDVSGISARMEMVSTTRTATTRAFVQQDAAFPQYNKLYHAIAHDDSVTAGTVWTCESLYQLNTIN